MGFFQEQLHTASLGGIEFPLTDRKTKYVRDIPQHEYPFRDGHDAEPTGRKGRVWELEVHLFTGMTWGGATPLFPETYEALISLFEDPDLQGEVEYVDPFIGP